MYHKLVFNKQCELSYKSFNGKKAIFITNSIRPSKTLLIHIQPNRMPAGTETTFVFIFVVFFFFFNPLIMLCVKSVEIKVDGSLGFINEQSMNFISFTETFSRGKCNLFHFSVGKLSFKLYILFNFWAVK